MLLNSGIQQQNSTIEPSELAFAVEVDKNYMNFLFETAARRSSQTKE